jgi:outer membrane protein
MRPLVLGSIPAGDDAPRSADSGLQSIGLTETLALGLEKDPRYRAAKADFLANAEATPQARAAYLPTATYDFQRNSENQRIISSTIDAYKAVQGQTQRYPVFSHVLTISQPIIKAPAWVKMEQAKISVEQSRLALVAAEQDLIIRVAAAYLNLLATQDGVELAKAEREATAKQAEQARVRLASGLGTVTQFNETEGASRSPRPARSMPSTSSRTRARRSRRSSGSRCAASSPLWATSTRQRRSRPRWSRGSPLRCRRTSRCRPARWPPRSRPSRSSARRRATCPP